MLSLTPRDAGMGWRIECRFSENGTEVLVDTKWNAHQQYGFGAKQANSVLVYMEKNTASRSRKIIIFIYSALVKHLLRCRNYICRVVSGSRLCSTGRTWQATVKSAESHEYDKRIGALSH